LVFHNNALADSLAKAREFLGNELADSLAKAGTTVSGVTKDLSQGGGRMLG